MKKLIFIILISLTVMSCSNSITVQEIETGKVSRIRDAHNVTKVGDTIVLVGSSLTYGSSFYGKYIGKLPETFTSNDGVLIYYKSAKRIK